MLSTDLGLKRPGTRRGSRTAEGDGCGCGGHHGQSGNSAATPSAMPSPTPAHAGGGCGCGQHHAEEPGKGCACRGLLPYRKLHALVGVVFGGFFTLHMLALGTGFSPARFDENARALHLLAGHFRLLEWLLVWLPLALLVGVGGYLLARAGLKYDLKRCKRGGKLRFFLQRLSALAIVALLALHLGSFKWAGRYDPAQPHASAAVTFSQPWSAGAPTHPLNLLVVGLYLVGIAGLVYHLANGLWTGAVAWGLCGTPRAQRRWGHVCLGVGLVLGLAGLVAWASFAFAPLIG